MTKTVVILGGSYAGLHVAHYLLKHHSADIKVILVSKNSHLYWNLGSVRAIVKESAWGPDKLFAPLSEILGRYPSGSYELVVGAATAADFAAKTVTVGGDDGRKIAYDHLVVATGSSTTPVPGHPTPWKADGGYEECRDLILAMQNNVDAATHVVVAGGGATGCEVAGEIAFDNASRKTRKEVVLLESGSEILRGDPVAGATAAELRKLDVQIRTGCRVEGVREVEGGKTEVRLAGGETIVTDLYLPSAGLVPNTGYVDAKFKDEKGRMLVDEELRVKGADGVWAAGDVVGQPRCGYLHTQKQAGGVAKNIVAVLNGKQPTPVKGMPFEIFVCATGRSRAAGRMGAVKMLSIMAWMGKGRTLGINQMPGYLDGSIA